MRKIIANAVIWGAVILGQAIVVKSGNGNELMIALAPILVGFFVSETVLFYKRKSSND